MIYFSRGLMVDIDKVEEFSVAYHSWIIKKMRAENHLILFDILGDVQFRWEPAVPMDKNRESDGRNLRNVFEYETGNMVPEIMDKWPASFLETVVAMAESMESNIMYSPGTDTDSSTWFWMMLSNIGIAQCDDDWFVSRNDGIDYVMEKVNKVLNRTYSRSGEGGFFPLDRPESDQRCVQLWYQMNAYILEKGW